MVRNIFVIIIILILLSLAAYLLFFNKTGPTDQINLQIKNKTYNLEIARSLNQKSQGLSNRTSLCSNCGMIFVYQSESYYPFWMKDTLIPLDMIWLDKEGRVVTIHTATPQPDTSLPDLKLYQNSKPARYIIELNAGESDNIGLRVGDRVNLPNLDET